MLENINWIEWLGYFASVLVFLSFLCSSIVKLRWISMIGSLLFGTYGFLIASYPTGILNVFIALVNLYYLIKMSRQNEYFSILKLKQDDPYFIHFTEFHGDELKKNYEGKFDLEKDQFDVSFYVLRDMVTCSIFLGKKLDEESLLVSVDYVTPEYRDFRVGKYIYNEHSEIFTEKGYKYLKVYPYNDANRKFLVKKIGFAPDSQDENLLVKKIA